MDRVGGLSDRGRCGDPRAGARAGRSERSERPREVASADPRALARDRQFRPRHVFAPDLWRAHFADHRCRFDICRDGHRDGDRHAGRVARRPPRYRHDAGDGRPAGVPVADPGPDPGGDARPLDGEHHHRHRVDFDPAFCPHRPRADDRGQGARVRRRRPRARLLRRTASYRPYPAEHPARNPGDGLALARQRNSHGSLACLRRPWRQTTDCDLGRHDPRRVREHSRQLLAGAGAGRCDSDRHLRAQPAWRRPARRDRSETEGRSLVSAPVLAVRNLTTAFRVDGEWITVVKGISFEIGQRETVAIVGESGSGKSVTALSIMGLLPAANSRATGEILLEGRDLLKLPENQMRHVRGNLISMIFQEPMTSLNPVLTLGFQIAEALIYHRGLDRARAEAETLRILERVRIPSAASRLHEYPHRLSGGMRQRVMIAMALACKPKLLIADEPTTALDVTIQAEILELIKILQDEEGMSVAFITHDMGVVAEIADRTVVMLNGNAVEQASTAEVFARPREPYTRALLAAVPRLGST